MSKIKLMRMAGDDLPKVMVSYDGIPIADVFEDFSKDPRTHKALYDTLGIEDKYKDRIRKLLDADFSDKHPYSVENGQFYVDYPDSPLGDERYLPPKYTSDDKNFDNFSDDDFDDEIISDWGDAYGKDYTDSWNNLSKRDKLRLIESENYGPSQFLRRKKVTEEITEPEVDVDSTGTSSDTDEENDDTDKNIISALLDKKY